MPRPALGRLGCLLAYVLRAEREHRAVRRGLDVQALVGQGHGRLGVDVHAGRPVGHDVVAGERLRDEREREAAGLLLRDPQAPGLVGKAGLRRERVDGGTGGVGQGEHEALLSVAGGATLAGGSIGRLHRAHVCAAGATPGPLGETRVSRPPLGSHSPCGRPTLRTTVEGMPIPLWVARFNRRVTNPAAGDALRPGLAAGHPPPRRAQQRSPVPHAGLRVHHAARRRHRADLRPAGPVAAQPRGRRRGADGATRPGARPERTRPAARGRRSPARARGHPRRAARHARRRLRRGQPFQCTPRRSHGSRGVPGRHRRRVPRRRPARAGRGAARGARPAARRRPRRRAGHLLPGADHPVPRHRARRAVRREDALQPAPHEPTAGRRRSPGCSTRGSSPARPCSSTRARR